MLNEYALFKSAIWFYRTGMINVHFRVLFPRVLQCSLSLICWLCTVEQKIATFTTVSCYVMFQDSLTQTRSPSLLVRIRQVKQIEQWMFCFLWKGWCSGLTRPAGLARSLSLSLSFSLGFKCSAAVFQGHVTSAFGFERGKSLFIQ